MVVLVLFFPFDTIVTWCKTSNAVRLDEDIGVWEWLMSFGKNGEKRGSAVLEKICLFKF